MNIKPLQPIPSGIIQAGIDWLTVTALTSDARTGLGVCARRLNRVVADLGNETKPWSFAGYSGFRSRGLQYGEREDSTIVRISGDVAHENWWEFYQIADSVTRVDWQVTWRDQLAPQQRVLAHHKEARKFWRGRKDGPTITLVQDDRGGATLYLGKRSSRIYLRCYNKHAESQEERWAMCVRYEAELKELYARHIMRELTSSGAGAATLASSVHEMFAVRGVSPPWQPNDYALKLQCRQGATDVEHKRQWLRDQVRPSVEFLCDRIGVEAVLSDLGLTQHCRAASESPTMSGGPHGPSEGG